MWPSSTDLRYLLQAAAPTFLGSMSEPLFLHMQSLSIATELPDYIYYGNNTNQFCCLNMPPFLDVLFLHVHSLSRASPKRKRVHMKIKSIELIQKYTKIFSFKTKLPKSFPHLLNTEKHTV